VIGKPPVALECSACNTPLSRSRGIEGLCPSCLIELALDDTSLEAEVLVDPEEAPTLQYSGYTFEEGQIQGERYRVRSLLGRGGMGEVWRAYDLKLRQDVALKALRTELIEDTEALETLRQEVRAAREVVSPNVCRVFDLQELDGQELVSMEYIDGTTLQETLKERSPLDLDEAREIASQFLAGLEAIHDAGLVHRDIKPENVMVTRTGRVVVMDFGIAKGLGDGKGGLIAGTPAYMSPEQSQGEELDARSDVFSAGVVLTEMVEPGGVHSFEDRQRVWEAIHQDQPEIAETPWSRVIGQCVAGDREARYATAAQLARALEEVTLRAVGGEDADPYPGLAFFTQEQSRYFYGRELEVEALWNRLRRAHLLALIAPSGSGKSSFLRAGLLPTLPDNWASILVTPGHRPSLALARALARELDSGDSSVDRLLQFEDPEVAVALVSEWRQQFKHALIILDQFEELFTQSPPEDQERFAELLGRLPLEADTFVLLSMREDFLYHCQPFEALAPVFSELMPLGTLTGNSLRRALVQPALKCGYRFEDDSLVDEMVEEVSHERGALPLLAFAASRLWDRRDRETGLITRDVYEQIGGVGGALAKHAEATLEQIGDEHIPIVRELFRNLVTAQGTRAARDRDELLSVFDGREGDPLGPQAPKPSESRSAAAEILDTLIDARLLTSYEVPADAEGGEPHHRIEIVHESLLANWPRLVRWQTQDADGAQLRDDLRQAAQRWQGKGRPEDLLWTGTAYREYQIWRERYPGGLTSVEEEFGDAMVHHADRRKRRRRAAVSAVIAALLIVVAVIGGFWRRSVAETRRAEASRLLALAEVRREEDPTESLAYTTASLELVDTEEARLLATKVLWEAPPALELDSGEAEPRFLTFSPEGDRLAAAGHKEHAWVWTDYGREDPVVLSGHQSGPRGTIAALWASNELLVTEDSGSPKRHCYIWNLPGGQRLRTIDFGGPSSRQVGPNRVFAEVRTLDAVGDQLVFRLRSWQLPDGEADELGRVAWTALGASWSSFDLNGQGWIYGKGNSVFYRPLPMQEGVPDRLIGSHENEVKYVWDQGLPTLSGRLWTQDAVTGELRLWSLSDLMAQPLRIVARPSGVEEGTRMIPDPSLRWNLQEMTRENQLRLWNLEAWPGARPITLRRSGSWQGAWQGFHPKGDWVVVSTRSTSRLTFWPLRGTWSRVVDGYTSINRPLAFSPDGEWLATNWTGEKIRFWPLPESGSGELRTFSTPANLGTLLFDPKGRFIITVGIGDDVHIVPLDGSPARQLESFADQDGLLSEPGISPSGRQAAAAYASGEGEKTLRVWDVETGELHRFDLPEGSTSAQMAVRGGIWSIAFTDESTLYTAGDGGVRRWDLENGSNELVYAPESGYGVYMVVGQAGPTALVQDLRDGLTAAGPVKVLDLATGVAQAIPAFGQGGSILTPLASSGEVAVTGDETGVLRVGRWSSGEPHLLLGHEGAIQWVAISPNGRWVASTGEDNTLRLWPMPDLDKPPLHTLPHDELIAKLKSLTNIRVVRDPEASGGWSVTLDAFPGWQEIPEW